MKLIYVSGAYRAPTDEGVEENIARARAVAINLWKTGWAVICPHANSSHMPVDTATMLEGDMEILKRCDAIYLLYGWGESEGAKSEYSQAVKAGLEIYEGEAVFNKEVTK